MKSYSTELKSSLKKHKPEDRAEQQRAAGRSSGPRRPLHSPVLHASDRSPNVVEKDVGEGEVSQNRVQSFCKVVRVLLVSSRLHDGGCWVEKAHISLGGAAKAEITSFCFQL